MNPLTFVGTFPYTKLDTQNIVSFQTLSILFNHEPPQPSSLPYLTDTIIYQFPHGYPYFPSIWMNWQNSSPAFPPYPGSGGTATTFYAFGDDTASGNLPILETGATEFSLLAEALSNTTPAGGTSAYLYLKVGVSDIEIHIVKVNFSAGNPFVPIYLAGTTVNMRIYCFIEPANTSTY